MNLSPPPRRGTGAGRTAIIDFGPDSAGWTGPASLADMLDCVGGYIDYAKIYAVNALLMPAPVLRQIVSVYARADVRTFSGGILFEWAYRQNAVEELPPLLRRLGIGGLEVSENYITLAPDERDGFVRMFRDEGFEVIYEFGRKTPETPLDVQQLADVVGAARAAGAGHVILEQSEIDMAASVDPSLLDRLASQSWFADVFLEVDPANFPRSHVAQINQFGSQVNLANVAPGQALRLEGLRRGIGRGVDYAMFHQKGELA